MKPTKGTILVKAKYKSDYKIWFLFSDGKESIVDFEPIIRHGSSLIKYLDKKLFEQDFKANLETGDIHWGKDWDMCFHIEQYYNESSIEPIKPKKRAGRKPVEDKKINK